MLAAYVLFRFELLTGVDDKVRIYVSKNGFRYPEIVQRNQILEVLRTMHPSRSANVSITIHDMYGPLTDDDL